MSNGPDLDSSVKAGNLPGLGTRSKRANKSNGIRAAIVAAVVTLILPSAALADDKQDCEKGGVEVRIAACSNILELIRRTFRLWRTAAPRSPRLANSVGGSQTLTKHFSTRPVPHLRVSMLTEAPRKKA